MTAGLMVGGHVARAAVRWVAIAVGLLIPAVVLLARDGFPHLALPVPLALGVGLLVVGV